MTMKKCFHYFLILMCTLLFACSKTSQDQTLILRLGAEPSMLNPILSTDSPSSSVNGYIFSGLLKVDEKMQLQPDLAETYTISEDGKQLVFYLKKMLHGMMVLLLRQKMLCLLLIPF